MSKRLLGAFLSLLVALSFSCSSDKGSDALVQDEYISVKLDISNDIEEDQPRSVRFAVAENGKPRFQFTNSSGEVSGTRKVYTTVTKGESAAREVIFEGELDWTIEQEGRKLAYKGELKILSSKFKDATNLMLYAVTGERKFNKTASEKQTELLSYLDENNTVNIEVPYVMVTPVKKVGDNTLTLADSKTALFKPKGVLSLFTIKNNLEVVIYPQYLKLYTPKYHRGVDINQYGDLTLSDDREDTPLLHRESAMGAIPSKSKTTLIAWLPKEDIENITEVRYIGFGMQGTLTKTSGSATDGSLLSYEIEFKPYKQPLDKGLAYTDNHGNVIPYIGVEGLSLDGPMFTPDEVKTRTTSEDAWLLKYYFPMWISRWAGHGVLSPPDINSTFWNQVHETSIPQNTNPEDYWKDTPGTTNASPFAEWIILKRGGTLHYDKSKFLYTQDSPGYMENGALYIARFMDNPEYRVLQRLRTVYWEDDARFVVASAHNNVSCEVSFLPYDQEAVANETAFSKAYWDARANEVQTIRFRHHYAVTPQGPYETEYNHILVPMDGTGIPLWFNTMRNFERHQNNDYLPMVTSTNLPIVTFVDKLPAKATL